MSRRRSDLVSGEGLCYGLYGLWLFLCLLARGGAWLFRLGMSHAGSEPEEPSGPPPGYVFRSRGAPLFDDRVPDLDEEPEQAEPPVWVEEPSAVDPWLAGDEDAEPPEPRDICVSREPDGTIMLRVKEPSRYRRKLIPPRSFT